jgi:hypothetical protein
MLGNALLVNGNKVESNALAAGHYTCEVRVEPKDWGVRSCCQGITQCSDQARSIQWALMLFTAVACLA